MKTSRLFRLLGGLCLAVLTAASTAFAFEGKVDMTLTNGPKDKDPMAMSYRMKGEKMRMDFGGADSSSKKKKKKNDAAGAMIMDFKKKEMTMLIDEEKMYMVRELPELKPEDTKRKKGDEEFKPTGRKEKIAGVEAEEYVGKADGRIVEVWVTKEMGRYVSQQGAEGKGGWEAFMEKENMFPLRTITRKKVGGPEESRMEVTAIDRSKQDGKLFEPPSDYTKMEMPNMGDMLKGLIPGR
ncbi:hypothetical protein CMV30_08790 [Nibricoccus aquaticus]|uniref:DUF4412 domain-containing protein n=1 Tax=Nibricoccus aquaticus TaxID=2576891 RepID=A0A290Q6Y8_9BACT|nr:DUF4412 domain-containing protein [Nibricoccus aquaticus]ATC64037.1 hypothetical protein CMV30_08790 [Nibricoccus aquaticus]